ncbi:immunoglobulin superfamily member 11 isoform X2 [Pseudophryne corroboree]|uniref:immunoglobulin superfamily member 11 isoform X2 n=1 Tax=Pseudophryne corroboree TaxID=495146 RepID=UPI003081F64F
MVPHDIVQAYKSKKNGLVTALQVIIEKENIQVARGQSAGLLCTFTTSAALTNLNIIWTVTPLSNANQPEQIIIYQGGQVFTTAAQFQGRVGFMQTMPNTNASIYINNTQLSDTGTYQCMVNNFPDRALRNIGVVGFTVLVPPSDPLCNIQGSLDVGSDITLSCHSEEGIPRPTYLWEKLNSNLPHPAALTQDQFQGTIILKNISTASSGRYQCASSNLMGTRTCLLDLQVVAPQHHSMGLLAGAIAGGILVLVICIAVVAVALSYWRNKHKEEEDEIPNEIREDDLPPKCSSSTKVFHPDASSSEHETLTSTNTFNGHYWNNAKSNYSTGSYVHYNCNGCRQSTARSIAGHPRPTYANGGQPSSGPPKTLVVTANTAPSPKTGARSNGTVGRKAKPSQTRSYAVSQATLERIGAVPVMIPAQSRAGSLV